MLLAADSQCLDDLFMLGWAVPREVPRAQEAERLVSELKQELQGQNACIAQLQHSSESNNESNSLLAAELELQLQAKAQLMREKARLQQENMLLWSERQLLAEQLGLHPADCSESNSLCQALSEQMQAAKRGQLAVKQLEGVIASLHEALVLGEGQHTDWQVSLQGLVCALCSSTAVMEASSELQPGPSSGLWLNSSITHCSLASSLRPAGSDTSHHSCMLSQHQGEGGGTLLGPGRGPASDSECSSLKTWRSSQSDVLEATHAVERRTACMTQLLETHAAHQHLSHSASRGSCESDASEGAEEVGEEEAGEGQGPVLLCGSCPAHSLLQPCLVAASSAPCKLHALMRGGPFSGSTLTPPVPTPQPTKQPLQPAVETSQKPQGQLRKPGQSPFARLAQHLDVSLHILDQRDQAAD
ncbi:hypothetical protein V8C86DRAFT_2727276 [Haematococcus lacustris]